MGARMPAMVVREGRMHMKRSTEVAWRLLHHSLARSGQAVDDEQHPSPQVVSELPGMVAVGQGLCKT